MNLCPSNDLVIVSNNDVKTNVIMCNNQSHDHVITDVIMSYNEAIITVIIGTGNNVVITGQ